jgi:hypothetical protein
MSGKHIILSKEGRTLIISEKSNGVITAIMQITAGAVTTAQLAYYEANLSGKIKQTEADLILKYFYGWDIEDD